MPPNAALVIPSLVDTHTINPLVDARRVRAHIGRLVTVGLPPRSIGQAAGVSGNTVLRLLYGGQQRSHLRVALSLLSVSTTPRAEQDIVLSIGAIRRVHALAAIGWPLSELGRQMDMSQANVSHMATRRLITYGRWAAVRDLYDRLAEAPGPSDTARAVALHKGWLPPVSWSPERIDDPSAAAGRTPGPVPAPDHREERQP